MEVPKWFDDPEAPRPCPCGGPMFPPMVPVPLDEDRIMYMHVECFMRAQSEGAFDDDE